jgi:hypothetical protein
MTMPNEDPVFKAFNDFGVDDMDPEASISRRMLRRPEDIDNATTQDRAPRTGGRPWHPASSRMPLSNSRPN